MHVWGGICQKVHYNALFDGGKNTGKRLNAETQSTQRKKKQTPKADPSVELPQGCSGMHPVGKDETAARDDTLSVWAGSFEIAKSFICITITHRSL